jgi:hypothetical protein
MFFFLGLILLLPLMLLGFALLMFVVKSTTAIGRASAKAIGTAGQAAAATPAPKPVKVDPMAPMTQPGANRVTRMVARR